MDSAVPLLVLGFFLGMRHATDADHVVAVTAIVSRERSIRHAAALGILWGIGHSATILAVGTALVVFGLVIPSRLGLSMELSVAAMLVLLGAMNVRSFVAVANDLRHGHAHEPHLDHDAPLALHGLLGRLRFAEAVRPLAVGVVHGLAGSAAIALLVLGAVRDAVSGVLYLATFGVGTIAGMMAITAAVAAPTALTATHAPRVTRYLALASGVLSIGFGLVLAWQVGFVDGLFGSTGNWEPR